MSSSSSPEPSKFRVILVDDEPLARAGLREALLKDPDITIVAECENGEQAVSEIDHLAPDIVLIDVQMPGLDGFGVLRALTGDTLPTVVFVTAHDAHALKAFEVNAVDYVMKPFDDARLRDAMERAKLHCRSRAAVDMESRLRRLLDDVTAREQGRSPAGHAERFMVRRDDRTLVVRASDIDWIDAAGNYVHLHVRKDEYKLRMTLRALGERLDPDRFVRIHKSTIVNIDRIKEIQPWFGGDYVAILTDGKQLRVSRTYAQSLLRPVQ